MRVRGGPPKQGVLAGCTPLHRMSIREGHAIHAAQTRESAGMLMPLCVCFVVYPSISPCLMASVLRLLHNGAMAAPRPSDAAVASGKGE